jgi:hypothetical protein
VKGVESKPSYRFFLGGHDLEMIEIRSLLSEIGLAERIVDRGLSWGARASAYTQEIQSALVRGETPVLIELADDLPAEIDRARIVMVDHHGERAGADRPSALRQMFDLVAASHGLAWSRRYALIEANDIGHVRALRTMGAVAEEIRSIRDADRAAQGVSGTVEQESRRAAAAVIHHGELAVVRTTAPTSSAVADFLLPEYGGPGADNLVVAMPDKLAFFGSGRVIEKLKGVQGCWYGGALPDYGYWGAPVTGAAADEMIEKIGGYLKA